MAREMKDSGIEWIGEIPKSWKIMKMSLICSVVTDYVASGSFADLAQNVQYLDEPDYAMLVRTADVSNKGHVSKPVFINQHAYEFLSNSNLFGGELLLPNIGAVGEIYIVPKLYERMSLAPNAIICKTRYCDKYYYYYFYCDAGKRSIVEISQSTAQAKFNKTDFRQIRALVPQENEQYRITEYLDRECTRIDSVIDQTRASIEEYKKLKQAVITQAVTKGIRPDRQMKDSGVEWIGEIPEEWSMSTIGQKIIFEGGSQPPLTQFIHESKEGYVRLIQNRDYKTDAYITYVPIESVSKFCTADDVMIGRYGPPMFVMHRGLTGAYNVALMKAIPQDIDKEWMAFVLQEYTLLRYVESFSKRAAGQDGVNPQILKKYPLPLPGIEEQREIAVYLCDKTVEIDNMINKKEQLISSLESYKKSLIYEYVTGKKEVPA